MLSESAAVKHAGTLIIKLHFLSICCLKFHLLNYRVFWAFCLGNNGAWLENNAEVHSFPWWSSCDSIRLPG